MENITWDHAVSSHLFFGGFFCLWIHPADSLQAVFKGPFDLGDHIFNLTNTSGENIVYRPGGKRRGRCAKKKHHKDAHKSFAVFGKSSFDKECPKSKAQSAVRVADAKFPAWHAALQNMKVIHKQLPSFSGRHLTNRKPLGINWQYSFHVGSICENYHK